MDALDEAIEVLRRTTDEDGDHANGTISRLEQVYVDVADGRWVRLPNLNISVPDDYITKTVNDTHKLEE